MHRLLLENTPLCNWHLAKRMCVCCVERIVEAKQRFLRALLSCTLLK